MTVCQSLLLLAIISLKIDFHLEAGRMLELFAVLTAGSLLSVLIGLWVSARASTPDQAITLAVLILLIQVIFSGLIPLEQMNALFTAFACLNSMRWMYGGLCGGANIADRWQDVGLGSQSQDVFRTLPFAALGVLSILMVGTAIALYFTLTARAPDRN